MRFKLGVLMDPILKINPKKDTTLAMLLAAQKRGWEIHYFEQKDLFLETQRVCARMQKISVQDDLTYWVDFHETRVAPLTDLDAVLMRKDPPFDIEYIYTTQLLALAQAQGVLVVNDPQSLRDYNEKLAIAWFPECCPPTLVTRDMARLKQFHDDHQDVVYKPLEGMGGKEVFRVKPNDLNLNVIIESLTRGAQRYIMAQQFIPEISEGDKRILLIDGKPVPYALARIPPKEDTRGNLAIGAKGIGVELSDRDLWICRKVGPKLKEKGLVFAGLDVIGDYLSEINITSPTCLRELEALYQLDIAGEFCAAVERRR